MKTQYVKRVKQAGFTLMELLVVFAIIGLGIVGILSVSNSASSGENSTQMVKDLTAIRAMTQSLQTPSQGYGTGSLNSTLIVANKIPSTMAVSGSTITTSVGGTLTVTGNTSNFKIAITNVPADLCTSLLTNLSNGWSSVQVGASPAITSFPVAPATATAAANCGGGAPFTVTWTTIS